MLQTFHSTNSDVDKIYAISNKKRKLLLMNLCLRASNVIMTVSTGTPSTATETEAHTPSTAGKRDIIIRFILVEIDSLKQRQ